VLPRRSTGQDHESVQRHADESAIDADACAAAHAITRRIRAAIPTALSAISDKRRLRLSMGGSPDHRPGVSIDAAGGGRGNGMRGYILLRKPYFRINHIKPTDLSLAIDYCFNKNK
jgi:hypothetical protein